MSLTQSLYVFAILEFIGRLWRESFVHGLRFFLRSLRLYLCCISSKWSRPTGLLPMIHIPQFLSSKVWACSLKQTV